MGLLDFLEKVAAEGDFVIVGLHTDPVSMMLYVPWPHLCQQCSCCFLEVYLFRSLCVFVCALFLSYGTPNESKTMFLFALFLCHGCVFCRQKTVRRVPVYLS